MERNIRDNRCTEDRLHDIERKLDKMLRFAEITSQRSENIHHQLILLEKRVMGNQDTINQLTQQAQSMQNDIAALVTSQSTLITTTGDLTDKVKALLAQIGQGTPPESLDFSALQDALTKSDAAVIDAKQSVDTANTNNPDPGAQGSASATP